MGTRSINGVKTGQKKRKEKHPGPWLSEGKRIGKAQGRETSQAQGLTMLINRKTLK
jgi:hypothetical protein